VEEDRAWSENGSAKGALAAVSVGCETRVAAEPLSRATAPATPCRWRGVVRARRRDRGRSITLHPQEPFFIQVRQRARSPQGRVVLCKRIAVEHRLAAIHIGKATALATRGLRKNLFALLRYAALSNLNVVDQLRHAA
jgi:hypothetical protein